jgi:hypothetical protein
MSLSDRYRFGIFVVFFRSLEISVSLWHLLDDGLVLFDHLQCLKPCHEVDAEQFVDEAVGAHLLCEVGCDCADEGSGGLP